MWANTPVLSRLDLRINADDRIALIGRNGNGKTTLARLLAGQLKPTGGSLTASGKLRVGYFAQHQNWPGFGGAVIVVSHDRHLLGLIADRLVLVDGWTAKDFAGSLDDYRELVLKSGNAALVPSAANARTSGA